MVKCKGNAPKAQANNCIPVPPQPDGELQRMFLIWKSLAGGRSARSMTRRQMKRNIERDDWNGITWEHRQHIKRACEFKGTIRYNSQGRRINDDGEECLDIF